MLASVWLILSRSSRRLHGKDWLDQLTADELRDVQRRARRAMLFWMICTILATLAALLLVRV